jgi:hypothetical protein
MSSSRRLQGDAGVTLVLWAVLLIGLLIMVAIAIDLDHARSSSRLDQSVADLAALAGGGDLARGDYVSACKDVIGNLNANLPGLTAITPSTFCSQAGNDVSQTVCSTSGTETQAAPSITEGQYTITLHFPVPDAEITDPGFGAGINDGTPCQRLRVIISNTEPVFFSGIVGNRGLRVTRSATVRGHVGNSSAVPAMWLLDPTGCTSLTVNGQSRVTIGAVGPPAAPGLLAVDSDGSACGQNQDTVAVNGVGSLLQSVPTTGTPSGEIDLYAPGASSCLDPACNASDVANGRLVPQPSQAPARATRAPADWRYNCKQSYPLYHGIVVGSCPNATTTQPYIDTLRTAVGTSGAPDASFTPWPNNIGCNPSGNVVVPSGNYWISCSTLKVGNGTTLTFTGGNVVLDGNLSISNGGSVSFNANNGTAQLPIGCETSVCIDNSSRNAAFVYFRAGGNLTVTGGSSLAVNNAAVYQSSGYISANGTAPTWTAPTEGPFSGLALWSELSSNKFQIAGGGGADLSGTFFVPEAAPFTLSGGGNWGEQHAQFVAFHAVVTGGSIFDLVPDPTLLSIPPPSGFLIR